MLVLMGVLSPRCRQPVDDIRDVLTSTALAHYDSACLIQPDEAANNLAKINSERKYRHHPFLSQSKALLTDRSREVRPIP